IARKKMEARGLGTRAVLARGNAEALPFPEKTFDGVCIAFGIRNVRDRIRALAEMRRVTRPGGRIIVLELCEPERGLFSSIARLHVRHVIPKLGSWLSGKREYRYLQESIAAFPSPESFARTVADIGLEVDKGQRMAFGACCLFVARVPGASSE